MRTGGGRRGYGRRVTALLACSVVLAVVAGVRGTWSPCGLSMVSAINPMSERGRGHRYALTCLLFVLGALVGGVLLGCAAALLSLPAALLPTDAALVLAVLAGLVTLASDLQVGGVALPRHPRQVDEDWLSRYRRWVYASGFGLQVGSGFATYVMTAATYLLVVLAALTGSPPQAALVGALFGAVRGLAVILSARATTPEGLRALHRRLAALDRPSLRLAIAAQAAVVVVLAGLVGGPAAAVLVAGAVGVGLLASGEASWHAVRPTRRDA